MLPLFNTMTKILFKGETRRNYVTRGHRRERRLVTWRPQTSIWVLDLYQALLLLYNDHASKENVFANEHKDGHRFREYINGSQPAHGQVDLQANSENGSDDCSLGIDGRLREAAHGTTQEMLQVCTRARRRFGCTIRWWLESKRLRSRCLEFYLSDILLIIVFAHFYFECSLHFMIDYWRTA